jgi:hypothetical protein
MQNSLFDLEKRYAGRVDDITGIFSPHPLPTVQSFLSEPPLPAHTQRIPHFTQLPALPGIHAPLLQCFSRTA